MASDAAQWVNGASIPSLTAVVGSLGRTGWKEKPDPIKLSSDLYTHTLCYVYTHTHIYTRTCTQANIHIHT